MRNQGEVKVHLTRAMMDSKMGSRIRCWEPPSSAYPKGRYRWFAAVDAREHLIGGTVVLAVNTAGAHLTIDPDTYEPEGGMAQAREAEPVTYDLDAYNLGELRALAQEAGVAFMGLTEGQVKQRLKAIGFTPKWAPSVVRQQQIKQGERVS